jgi:hypothetical protein
MDTLKESCTGKMILMTAWQNAGEVHSKAVAEVTKNIGVAIKEEYDRLVKAVEHAHNWMMDAQANFEAHVKEHGCGEGHGGLNSKGKSAAHNPSRS